VWPNPEGPWTLNLITVPNNLGNPLSAAPRRNDAGLAGAELALAVEAAALGTGAPDTVATTGRVALAPNTVNSVPREARRPRRAARWARHPCCAFGHGWLRRRSCLTGLHLLPGWSATGAAWAATTLPPPDMLSRIGRPLDGACAAAPQAALEIDLRDTDEPRRDAVLAQILEAATNIAQRRRVRLQTEVVNSDAPATCAPEARLIPGIAQLRPTWQAPVDTRLVGLALMRSQAHQADMARPPPALAALTPPSASPKLNPTLYERASSRPFAPCIFSCSAGRGARQVVAAASAAAEQLGASHARLVSRAYHDALFMAQVGARQPAARRLPDGGVSQPASS